MIPELEKEIRDRWATNKDLNPLEAYTFSKLDVLTLLVEIDELRLALCKATDEMRAAANAMDVRT